MTADPDRFVPTPIDEQLLDRVLADQVAEATLDYDPYEAAESTQWPTPK